MRLTPFLLLGSILIGTYASAATPGFQCKSSNGNTIKVIPSFGEIQTYNSRNELVTLFDALKMTPSNQVINGSLATVVTILDSEDRSYVGKILIQKDQSLVEHITLSLTRPEKLSLSCARFNFTSGETTKRNLQK